MQRPRRRGLHEAHLGVANPLHTCHWSGELYVSSTKTTTLIVHNCQMHTYIHSGLDAKDTRLVALSKGVLSA